MPGRGCGQPEVAGESPTQTGFTPSAVTADSVPAASRFSASPFLRAASHTRRAPPRHRALHKSREVPDFFINHFDGAEAGNLPVPEHEDDAPVWTDLVLWSDRCFRSSRHLRRYTRSRRAASA